MNKKEYRRFKVKTVDKVDDYASLREVLTRRFRKYLEMENPPQLILIDGGKGQLSQGIEVREKLGLNIKVFSIAKKKKYFTPMMGKR